MPVRHAFQSGISDGGDTALVRPSDWNDDHELTAPNEVEADEGTHVSQTTGGVDAAMAANYEAVKFTAPATSMGSVTVRLRRDLGVTAGDVRAFLYTDVAGAPGLDISDTSTGQPSIMHLLSLAGTYVEVQFKLHADALTPSNAYWIVFQKQGLAGGSFYFDSRASGVGLHATSPDGTTWTLVNTKQLWHVVLDISDDILIAHNENGFPLYVTSTSGIPIRALSKMGIAVKGDSDENVGVGGTSKRSFGVRASSNHHIALQAVSEESSGAQIIGAGNFPGAQIVSVNGPAVQAICAAGQYFQGFATNPAFGGVATTWGALAEEITLSGGATTDSVADLLPANSIIDSVGWYWTQGIAGAATGFQIGTSADAERFVATSVAIALGNSGVGLNHLLTGGHALANQAAAKIRITLNGTTSAGKIRIVVFFRAFTAPSF